MSEEKQGFFDGASPKLLFGFGLTIGIAVISLIGFMITLGIVVGADGSSVTRSNSNSNTNAQVAGDTDTAKTVTDKPEVLLADANIRGDKDADITVLEFSDFQCPYCADAHPTLQQLLADNDGKVNWAYKHLPLSIHAQAQPAAQASECAAEQGKFWEFADQLFANQSKLGSSYYSELAGTVGLDVGKFDSCVKSNKYQSKVAGNLSLAQKNGAGGTPYFILINNKSGRTESIEGALPIASFQQAVDLMLES